MSKSSSTSVLGKQFCLEKSTELMVIKGKTGLFLNGKPRVKHFKINNNLEFKVKRSKVHGLDRCVLKDADKKSLLTMQEKVSTGNKEWQVFREESELTKDHLFHVKKTSVVKDKTHVDVFLAANMNESTCNFKIKGDYLTSSSVIYLGESTKIVAKMTKESASGNTVQEKDTFYVTVNPHVDYVLIAALVVLLDEISQD